MAPRVGQRRGSGVDTAGRGPRPKAGFWGVAVGAAPAQQMGYGLRGPLSRDSHRPVSRQDARRRATPSAERPGMGRDAPAADQGRQP